MRLARFAVLGLGLPLVAAMSACSSIETQHRDWSGYEGPGREYFLEEEVRFPAPNDPAEPTNRAVWSFNSGFLDYVARPVSSVWRTIFPGPIRDGLRNFGNNILYPVRLVANLAQGNGTGAWNETKRFGVNTTAGILGLRDYAGDDIEKSDEDMGQAFGSWGWDESAFVVLPVLGPSTVRDTVGLIPDTLLDPATYFFPASPVRTINSLSDQERELRRLEETSYDLYYSAQRLFTMLRTVDVTDYAHPENDCEHCLASETIEAIFLTYKDPDFPQMARHGKAKIPATGKSLPYTLFLQPEPAPIVYILPGLGGHRLDGSSLGLAEMVYAQGFSAVTISSAMNFEFMESASTAQLPGFAPVDAHDVHVALDRVHQEIEAKHEDRVTSHVLMGISLGAFHTLYIAAHESDNGTDLGAFDGYIALNPPVSLEYGLHQLDDYFNAPMSVPADKREGMILHTLREALEAADGSLHPSEPLPFAEIEAQFLIGLSFRQTLQDVIFQTQLRHNRGVLKTELSASDRSPAYQEIADYSYAEYFYGFVLPYYAELREDVTPDEAGARRLFELCDLRSIAEPLAANGRVHVITNVDDFLLTPGDLAWLAELLGDDRVHRFEHGGHLGNLYMPGVQERVMSTFHDLAMPAKSQRPARRCVPAR